MIIFNKKEHFDNLMLNGFEKYPNKRDLIILAKEWHFGDGIIIDDIYGMLVEFCTKWNKEFNAARYENTLIGIIDILKEPQQELKAYDKIKFYKSEVESINNIVGENEKQVLFILMSICKMRKVESIYLNSGTPLKLKEIFELSNVKLTAMKQDLLLGSLYRQKVIDVHIKPLLKCDVLTIDNDGELAFGFIPSELMIDKYYDNIKQLQTLKLSKKFSTNLNKNKKTKDLAIDFLIPKKSRTNNGIEYSKNIKNRIGDERVMNNGLVAIILGFTSSGDSKIEFEDGYKKTVPYSSFLSGAVKNPYHASICGVGYIGEGMFNDKDDLNSCSKSYSVWRSMIERCYDENKRSSNITYSDCCVCAEWHNYQNFAVWFETNYIKGLALDKDLLVKGNRIYSPDACCFLPRLINSALTTKHSDNTNDGFTGVKKEQNGFSCQLNNYEKSIYKGIYLTAELAYEAYKKHKEDYVHGLAEEYKDVLTILVYNALKNWKV